jgi:peptide-methionine (S)-S-oxide reductase
MNKNIQSAIFAGGCFWCTEAVFQDLKGVISVLPGYTGGNMDNPTYDRVSGGNTGHAEAIKIDFDQDAISFDDLLSVFFNTHDPTTLNRQGNDVGTQYRSAIFYTNEEQKIKAENIIKELNDNKAYDKPVVTEVKKFEKFFEAEDYHKNYYKNNKEAGYCQIIIAPKLEKLQKRFNNLIK